MPEAIISRAEHLQWCKDRAMEYVRTGDYQQALSSMGSDLNKHPETRNHSAINLGLMLLMGGQMDTYEKTAKFIQGYN